MTNRAEQDEQEAMVADEQEHLTQEGTPAAVQVGPRRMSSSAVRFGQADVDRRRARAGTEGVGVTQPVRAWVLERLAEQDAVPLEAGEALSTLRRLVAHRAWLVPSRTAQEQSRW